MDNLDKRILWELQNDFPVCQRPYDVIAQRLGLSEEEVWMRTKKLLDSGLIRRIGASFDSRKLGFSSTLAAVRVSQEMVDRAEEVIGRYDQVTHSYLRDDEFNIWFTVIAETTEDIARILGEIRTELGLAADDVMNLPADEVFKLDTRFDPNSKERQ